MPGQDFDKIVEDTASMFSEFELVSLLIDESAHEKRATSQ